jgi:2-dehydro-3-deoxyphosphooctonate aldolase (KDO 8-P synthase)
MPNNPVCVGKAVAIGQGQPLALIAGPCVIESHELTLQIAERLAEIGTELSIPIIFKASFDKANRSSIHGFRGPGLDSGLRTLEAARQLSGLPLTTDVHEPHQAAAIAQVCDVLQIPAFLARQTDLIAAAAATGKPINVKKGQFMAPWDMKNVVQKAAECGNHNVLLAERGTTFGYGRLVNDMRAIPIMQQTGCPVVFDATHSVQLPSAEGDRSGGERHMIPYLARAAVAVGCDALFMEVHPTPDKAKSDGPNALELDRLPQVLQECLRVRAAISNLEPLEEPMLHGPHSLPQPVSARREGKKADVRG